MNTAQPLPTATIAATATTPPPGSHEIRLGNQVVTVYDEFEWETIRSELPEHITRAYWWREGGVEYTLAESVIHGETCTCDFFRREVETGHRYPCNHLMRARQLGLLCGPSHGLIAAHLRPAI